MTQFETMLPLLLAKIVPPKTPTETDSAYADRIDLAWELFGAFNARDPIEAMLALQAVGAHFAAIEALQTAVQPDTDLGTASRARADAVKLGRDMRANTRAIERRQQPAAAETTKTAQHPWHREPEPQPEPEEQPDVVELAPDLTEERLGGYAKRRRILDSAPVQAFWVTHHPIEVDIDAAWSNAIRAGLNVVDAEDAQHAQDAEDARNAENAVTSLAP